MTKEERLRKEQVARVSQWRRENARTFSVQCHNVHDKDIIEFMDKLPNKQRYIRNLIRKDIRTRQIKGELE